MPALVLIRHSTPKVDPEASTPAWELTAEGKLSARALAEALGKYEPGAVMTSPERKAQETAAIIAASKAVPVITDEDLREHERASAGFLPTPAFLHGIEQLLRSSRDLVFGDETADAVFHRFSRAIERAREFAPDRDQLVVSHGTAISLYVGRTVGVDPYGLWRELRTPTAVIIQDGLVETVIAAGAEAR